MAITYSTYEAKARFSEILRRVRDGQHVTISYHGVAVAEIRPVYHAGDDEQALREMEDSGTISRPSAPSGPLEPIRKRPGALERLLESREPARARSPRSRGGT